MFKNKPKAHLLKRTVIKRKNLKLVLCGVCILMGPALGATLVQVSGYETLKTTTQKVFPVD